MSLAVKHIKLLKEPSDTRNARSPTETSSGNAPGKREVPGLQTRGPRGSGVTAADGQGWGTEAPGLCPLERRQELAPRTEQRRGRGEAHLRPPQPAARDRPARPSAWRGSTPVLKTSSRAVASPSACRWLVAAAEEAGLRLLPVLFAHASDRFWSRGILQTRPPRSPNSRHS